MHRTQCTLMTYGSLFFTLIHFDWFYGLHIIMDYCEVSTRRPAYLHPLSEEIIIFTGFGTKIMHKKRILLVLLSLSYFINEIAFETFKKQCSCLVLSSYYLGSWQVLFQRLLRFELNQTTQSKHMAIELSLFIYIPSIIIIKTFDFSIVKRK